MPSHRPQLPAGFAVSVFVALTLWCGAPLVADNAHAPAVEPVKNAQETAPPPGSEGSAREQRMRRGRPFDGDVRALPQTSGSWPEQPPEREPPEPNAVMVAPGSPADAPPAAARTFSVASLLEPPAPAPPASPNFEGLDHDTWGASHPASSNGDAGPDFYIQAINASIGIFRKTGGAPVAAFTFNTFMSQGQFGNPCDTNNVGNPIVLYDTFEDRWIITDVAFAPAAGGGAANPPGAFQCFAASKSGDPLAGGWNFYSINTTGGLGDYPKFGIWPDGLYMSANMFDYAAGSAYQNPRVFALNKAQMYAGAPMVQVVSFDAPAADFTLLPGNARLQTGTPPPGTPNYFISTWQFLNAVGVYSFHVDWNSVALSTFTGPAIAMAASARPNAAVPNAPTQLGNSLDVVQLRAMMQNQYSNIGGVESLWATHTVRRANTTGFAAPRWYQVNVSSGLVGANLLQAATWDPDGANVMHRYVPSLAVDRAGNMALGYSTSSTSTKPAIKYAGRLADDTVNTFSRTEQVLIQGTGTQTGSCGAGACFRWGDYTSMTLDPDGCTFWYTNAYYVTDGLNYHTRIGAFAFPGCVAVTNTGALQGIVTAGGAPIAGATVALGSRTTTTDENGGYAFTNLPPGTYSSVTASLPGYASQTFVTIPVSAGEATFRDFTLTAAAPLSACLIDTTQADFQTGVATRCDLTKSPGDVTLIDTPAIDQQNPNVTTTLSFAFTATTWAGQTFTPSVTAEATRIDLDLFCSNCTGTTPNLTVSIRATAIVAGNLVPTGPDLATATIPGFSSATLRRVTANFATSATLTANTRYALIVRPVVNPAPGSYNYVASPANTYTAGQRVTSGNSGTTWTADVTAGGRDIGFRVFMKTGFTTSGTFVSSVKDANPAPGTTATWGMISWTADVPAATTLQFQAAASNNHDGPFTFVGPDGTAATFFTSGASLAQFNGSRYLKYRALLGTSSGAATPAIHEVSICFLGATVLSMDPASGVYGGTTALSATLRVGLTGVAGKPIAFTLNGADVGTAFTNGAGVATLSNVSLADIDAGTYPGAVAASFAGDPLYLASAASNTLTVTQQPQVIDFEPLIDKVATDPSFPVSATGGASGNPVTFSTESTACSLSGVDPTMVTLNAAGECAITADQAGNTNYSAAPPVTRTFTITFASQTITFPAIASFSWNGGSATLAATASSGLAVTYSVVSGPCQVSGSTLTATAAGTCLVAADQAGNEKYSAAPQVTGSAQVDRASQTLLFDALAAKTYGDPDFALTASASSGLPVSFAASGTCTVSGSVVHITGAGSCAITASQAGDANYLPAPDVTRTFAIAPATTVFSGLVNPPIVLSSLFATLNGRLGPAGLTTGVTVTVTLAGMTRTATVAADGTFSVQFLTLLLPSSPGLPVSYSFAGNANLTPASAASVLPVLYQWTGNCAGGPGHVVLSPLSPTATIPVKKGTILEVRFRVCNAFRIPVGWEPVVSHFYFMGNAAGATTPVSEVTDRPFTFELDELQWSYQLKTRSLVSGRTYYYRILLHDGSAIDFSFSLR